MSTIQKSSSTPASQSPATADGAGQKKPDGKEVKKDTGAFKDPFDAISPATQTKFDFNKVTIHGSELAEKARQRRDAMPDYATNADQDLAKIQMDRMSPVGDKSKKVEDKNLRPDDNNLKNLVAFQNTDSKEKEKTKGSKPAQETLTASNDFSQKNNKKTAASTGATTGSSKDAALV